MTLRSWLLSSLADELDPPDIAPEDDPRVDYEQPPKDCDGYGHPFHEDQLRAWYADRPMVAVCAGWQSGKTVSLPWFLLREIQRRGPGDYGAFSSTYALLEKKFLPELRRVFESSGLAIFHSSKATQQFLFTDEGSRKVHGAKWNGKPTIVQLGHAQNPDSLESATLKAVVWDECGQRLVPKQSFDTVVSRLMVNRGRLMLASKPYEINWFRDLVVNKDGRVSVVSYASWANPENPKEDDAYWIPIQAAMPKWKFDMQYKGIFTRPAGVIYDCFDEATNVCDDFFIRRAYKTAVAYPGMDFGEVNTAGIAAVDVKEIDTIFIVGDYHAGQKRDYPDHIHDMRKLLEPYAHGMSYQPGSGGNKTTESGWREAYRMHGFPLDEPDEADVEVQIQTVWGLINQGKIKFFRKGAEATIADIQVYSRETDENGEVLDKIQDKSKWHRLDALRYIIMKLRPNWLMNQIPKAGGEVKHVEEFLSGIRPATNPIVHQGNRAMVPLGPRSGMIRPGIAVGPHRR